MSLRVEGCSWEERSCGEEEERTRLIKTAGVVFLVYAGSQWMRKEVPVGSSQAFTIKFALSPP
jgi:hypothetical protein